MLLHRGDLRGAETEERSSLALQKDWQETGIGRAYGLGFLSEALVERGQLDEAAGMIADHRAGPADAEGGRFVRRSGDPARTRARRRRAGAGAARRLRPARRHVSTPPGSRGARCRRALGLLGRRAEALALLEPELEVARRWGARGSSGPRGGSAASCWRARGRSRSCARRPRCWRARRGGWRRRRRSPRSARGCGGAARRRRRWRCCAARSRSPTTAAPTGSPSRCAGRSTRAACGRAARRPPARRR